jgi:hypothetical protein
VPVPWARTRRYIDGPDAESDDEQYAWLNSEVCIAEGIHDPQNPPSRTEIYLCKNELE